MIPSRIMSAGNSPLSTGAITGGGTSGLVATGSTITDALQLSTSISRITTSSASTGVKLLPTENGMEMWIRNDSGQTITVYPFSIASTINAAATSFALTNAKTAVFKADSGTTWMGGMLA
jgi:outer membrane lipoprotein SlyB